MGISFSNTLSKLDFLPAFAPGAFDPLMAAAGEVDPLDISVSGTGLLMVPDSEGLIMMSLSTAGNPGRELPDIAVLPDEGTFSLRRDMLSLSRTPGGGGPSFTLTLSLIGTA